MTLLVLCVTGAWGDNEVSFVGGKAPGQINVTSGSGSQELSSAPVTINIVSPGAKSQDRQIWKDGSTAKNEYAFQLSSGAGDSYNTKYVEISVASGYKITGVTLRAANSGGTSAGTLYGYCFEGAFSTENGAVKAVGSFAVPGYGGTSDGANVAMTGIANNTRTVRIYKQVKYDSSTNTINGTNGSNNPSSSAISANIASITVTYEATAPAAPAAPTFEPGAGAIFAGNTVTLSSADEGTIYYTTDGSDPTAVVENLYSEPITVNEAMTIKAIAVKSGLTSTTATAAYTIKDVATPVISKKGLVVSGTQVTITSSDGNAATIYYTLDGSDPKTSDTKQTYSSPISITSSCTLNAVAKVNSTFSKSASASFTIGNANQYSYVYGSTKTSPSGASFTIPALENPTTVEIVYNNSGDGDRTWTDNKKGNSAYFQGNDNPTISNTDPKIPTAGAYIKLTPSNDGTITFIGHSAGEKNYFVKKADGTQLKTGKTPSSTGLYEINFDVEKNVVYYVYVTGSKIMFHGLTFTTKFNSIDVKIGVNGWTSYISNQNLDFGNATPSGLTAYAAIYGEENITLNNVTKVPANKGLVLRGTANTTYTVPVLASTGASVTTDLKGNATSDYAVDQTNNNYYVLANVGGEEGFYEYTGTAAIPAGKAFFEVAAGGAKFLPIIISEDETDGIKSVQGSRFTVNGEAYNLSGQRVGKDYKGIVIVNGKKVIRK